jgi:DNA-binding transcriptional ArsR family regulator
MSLAPEKGRRHTPLSAEAVELVAARFRVLGEPVRVQILQILQSGDRNVTELVEAIGSTQPNVSRHLRILQEAGLVDRRQEGTSVYYSIADPTVFDLCDAVCGSISARLTQHAAVGDELRQYAGRETPR